MVLVDLVVAQRIVFKIIHVNLTYVGHGMNLYFDESTPEKDNQLIQSLEFFLYDSLRQ